MRTMSKTTDKSLQPVRTIRLPAEQIVAMLDEMDIEPAGWHVSRRDSRYKYRIQEVVVLMQQPGVNAPMAYLVPTRNISARGLSFLHGGFVHPGTMCVVQLVTARGGQQNVVGTVRRCRYIQSNVHEVAVQFKNAIDPAAFCRNAVPLHALVAEDDAGLAKLCKLHLGKLQCEVAIASDGQSALDMAAGARFDLILLDMELPPTNGFDVARKLRSQGYGGTIIAGTSSDSAEDKSRSLEAGCDHHMVKPFACEKLAQATTALQSEPLFSTYHDDPAMNELISEFVSGLPIKVRELELALSANDGETLRLRLAEIKVESRGFGFDEIASACEKADQALRSKAVNATAISQLRSVIRLCAQARSAPTPRSIGERPGRDAKSPAAKSKRLQSDYGLPPLSGPPTHELE